MRSKPVQTGLVEGPSTFLKGLGEFHDLRVEKMILDVDRRLLQFYVEDLFTNYDSLVPQYERLPGVLEFAGVDRFCSDLDFSEGVRIQRAAMTSEDGVFVLGISLNKGGNRSGEVSKSILVKFRELKVSHLRKILGVISSRS